MSLRKRPRPEIVPKKRTSNPRIQFLSSYILRPDYTATFKTCAQITVPITRGFCLDYPGHHDSYNCRCSSFHPEELIDCRREKNRKKERERGNNRRYRW
ncbi:hypothetical protein PUN28_008390 [Cardiocondyla obscurior]|uniref:Uncharacterized protein n=1 Tax=Cardiocondyla obscurior TaxID=286306 RepID=A0AAW2G034_9HYME